MSDWIEKEHDHKLKIGIHINQNLIVISSYFIITAFLQYTAIRYNSLVSLPIAIFAAYGIYFLGKLAMKENGWGITIASSILIFLFGIYIFRFFSLTSSSYYLTNALGLGIGLIVLGVFGFLFVLKKIENPHTLKMVILLVLIIAILAIGTYYTASEAFGSTQADGINPSFLQAMVWLKNNSPQNATVFTKWPDGSVVEAWANRTSYVDSVGGENATRIYLLSSFLFNTTNDQNFFNRIDRPQQSWWQETSRYNQLGGIAGEGLVGNVSEYGYVTLSSFQRYTNSTSIIIILFKCRTPILQGRTS